MNEFLDAAAWAQNGLALWGQTSLLLGVGLAVLRVLRRRQSAARDVMGRALLVSTLAVAALSLGLSLNEWNRPAALWSVSLAAPARSADTSTVSLSAPAPLSDLKPPPTSKTEKTREEPSFSPSLRENPLATKDEPTPALALAASAKAPQVREGRGVVTLMVGLWLGGALGLLLWWGACHQALRRLRRGAHAVRETETLAILDDVCAALGVRAPLLLRHSAVNSPFLMGLLHPAIVLPAGDAPLEPEMLRAVFSHEAMHLKRRDLWWNALGRIGCALLWPQPLLWVLCRAMEESSEDACDQAVLEVGCSRGHYARALLDWAEHLAPRPAERVAAIGIATGKSSLARRVQTILDTSHRAQPISPRGRWCIVGGALAAIATVPLLVSGSAAPRESEQGSVGAKNAASNQKRALQQFKDFGKYRVSIAGVSSGVLQGVTIEQKHDKIISRSLIVARTARRSVAGSWILRDALIYSFDEEKGLISEARSVRLDLAENFALSAYFEQQSQAISQPLAPSRWQELRRSLELPTKELATVEKWAAMQPRGAITGRVANEDGEPVAGIKIRASLSYQSMERITGRTENASLPSVWANQFALPKVTRNLLSQSTTTASDGTYRIEGLAPQTYGLQVPSYRRMSRRSRETKLPPYVQAAGRDVTVRGGRTTAAPDVPLTRGGLLRVRVVDKTTGAALPDINLLAFTKPNANKSVTPYWVDTDASGESLFRLPAGGARLSVGGQISSRVRDVAATSGGVDYFPSRKADISFDGGAFQRFTGGFVVKIARDRTREALLRLERAVYVAPSPKPVFKRMPPPQGKATLTGRVVDEAGRGVSGVPVLALIQQKAQWKLMQGAGLAYSNSDTPNFEQKWASIEPVLSESAVTRADGSFRLNGLTTAPYNLVIATSAKFGLKPPPNGVAAAVEGVWVREGQIVRRAAPLVFRRGALIEGRVVDKATGLGLGGVTFGSNGPQLPLSVDTVMGATSDSQGRFSLRVARGTTSIYIAGPNRRATEEDIVYADTQKPANTYRIGTSRGLYGGSDNVQFEVDNGAPQFGLNLRSRSKGRIEIEAQNGQTRRLTLRLRRLIAKK